jgi:uncharacterized membrane-anchored protein
MDMHKIMLLAAVLAAGALTLGEAPAQQEQQQASEEDMKVTGMVTAADQQTGEITIDEQTEESGGASLFPQVGAEITLFYREEGDQKVITRIGQKEE